MERKHNCVNLMGVWIDSTSALRRSESPSVIRKSSEQQFFGE